MRRVWALLTLVLALESCGVAGTGTASATGAAAEAQQAAQATQTEDRVKQQIGAAGQQAEDQRRAAEAAAR